ncbi:hypothetical protein HA052_16635 [Chromobacterium haemolyticum]|uniref:Secreted protein n=1 Tax=Chromobacterium fluminis TaxID=3044269 RepID=A0ABX0L7Q0_9NEIS|nr:hypothetical protein [Chromobacterium haemolyticum]NHR06815.1 hypothetical protein [Chromobacterium haemolyticum]
MLVAIFIVCFSRSQPIHAVARIGSGQAGNTVAQPAGPCLGDKPVVCAIGKVRRGLKQGGFSAPCGHPGSRPGKGKPI